MHIIVFVQKTNLMDKGKTFSAHLTTDLFVISVFSVFAVQQPIKQHYIGHYLLAALRQLANVSFCERSEGESIKIFK